MCGLVHYCDAETAVPSIFHTTFSKLQNLHIEIANNTLSWRLELMVHRTVSVKEFREYFDYPSYMRTINSTCSFTKCKFEQIQNLTSGKTYYLLIEYCLKRAPIIILIRYIILVIYSWNPSDIKFFCIKVEL
jgi:hypothetical protein